MRRELIWASAFLTFSILLVAVLTSFRFYSFEVQLLDLYFTVEPLHVIFFLPIILISARYAFLLIVFLIKRYKVLAVIIALIIPLAIYYPVLSLYMIFSFMITDPTGEITVQNTSIIFVPYLLIIAAFIAIEIIAIRKIVPKNQ